MSYEYVRPDSLPTVIFGQPELDLDPILTRHGRLIPGPGYSKTELAAKPPERAVLPSVEQLARIALNAETGCWELPVYDDPKPRARYGRLSVQGIHNPSRSAHRTMFLIFYGADALPGGRAEPLDHLCEFKPCCYPRHLERVSPSVNNHRGHFPAIPGQEPFDFASLS